MKSFISPLLLLAMLGLAVVSSCKKNPASTPDPGSYTLRMNVFPVYGNATLYLDSTYHTAEGYDVQFTDIKFYAHQWKYADNYLTYASLFDYREKGNNFIVESTKPEQFPSLQGYLGVGPDDNHSDPTAYPNHSALNIMNAGGMHWGWNPGYIFIKVEAKVDTIPDGTPLFDHYAVFHVGTDAFLQTISFPTIHWVNTGGVNYEAKLRLDMQQFLVNGSQAIDLKTEYITHSAAGQEALSQKAIQNFKDALSLMN